VAVVLNQLLLLALLLRPRLACCECLWWRVRNQVSRSIDGANAAVCVAPEKGISTLFFRGVEAVVLAQMHRSKRRRKRKRGRYYYNRGMMGQQQEEEGGVSSSVQFSVRVS
jgi:hypothetical protein